MWPLGVIRLNECILIYMHRDQKNKTQVCCTKYYLPVILDGNAGLCSACRGDPYPPQPCHDPVQGYISSTHLTPHHAVGV